MEDFDESVNGTQENARAGKGGLMAIMVAAVGIIVGVTGIVLANMAQSDVRALEARLAAQPDKSADLEKKLADLDARLVKLGDEFVKLGRADRQIQESTQAAFNEVAGSIKANRDAINEMGTKLTELVGRLDSGRAPARVASTGGSSGGSDAAAAEPVPEEGVYLVQSGDTLSKIASRFGVSLSALMTANPNVNPNRMQIGQRIVIPKP